MLGQKQKKKIETQMKWTNSLKDRATKAHSRINNLNSTASIKERDCLTLSS